MCTRIPSPQLRFMLNARFQGEDKGTAARTCGRAQTRHLRDLLPTRSRSVFPPELLFTYNTRQRGLTISSHHAFLNIGPDPNNPKPILRGLARVYQGLGVSALRSVTTHGLLWTFFDLTASYIDRLPGRVDDS